MLEGKNDERRAVLVEQDLNTLGEQANSRVLSLDDIRDFFSLAPDELDSIMGLYFPVS